MHVILTENSFAHGVAMGTKTAVNGNVTLMTLSPFGTARYEVDRFIEQANKFHQTIKFTAEISENEITFLDAVVIKGDRFVEKTILDNKTHYKPTETFQYTHFSYCPPPGITSETISDSAECNMHSSHAELITPFLYNPCRSLLVCIDLGSQLGILMRHKISSVYVL